MLTKAHRRRWTTAHWRPACWLRFTSTLRRSNLGRARPTAHRERRPEQCAAPNGLRSTPFTGAPARARRLERSRPLRDERGAPCLNDDDADGVPDLRRASPQWRHALDYYARRGFGPSRPRWARTLARPCYMTRGYAGDVRCRAGRVGRRGCVHGCLERPRPEPDREPGQASTRGRRARAHPLCSLAAARIPRSRCGRAGGTVAAMEGRRRHRRHRRPAAAAPLVRSAAPDHGGSYGAHLLWERPIAATHGFCPRSSAKLAAGPVAAEGRREFAATSAGSPGGRPHGVPRARPRAAADHGAGGRRAGRRGTVRAAVACLRIHYVGPCCATRPRRQRCAWPAAAARATPVYEPERNFGELFGIVHGRPQLAVVPGVPHPGRCSPQSTVHASVGRCSRTVQRFGRRRTGRLLGELGDAALRHLAAEHRRGQRLHAEHCSASLGASAVQHVTGRDPDVDGYLRFTGFDYRERTAQELARPWRLSRLGHAGAQCPPSPRPPRTRAASSPPRCG